MRTGRLPPIKCSRIIGRQRSSQGRPGRVLQAGSSSLGGAAAAAMARTSQERCLPLGACRGLPHYSRRKRWNSKSCASRIPPLPRHHTRTPRCCSRGVRTNIMLGRVGAGAQWQVYTLTPPTACMAQVEGLHVERPQGVVLYNPRHVRGSCLQHAHHPQGPAHGAGRSLCKCAVAAVLMPAPATWTTDAKASTCCILRIGTALLRFATSIANAAGVMRLAVVIVLSS